MDHATDRLPLQSGKRQSCTFFPRIKPLRHTQPQTVFVIKQHIIQYRRRQVIGQVHTQLERVRQFVVCIDFSILQCNPDNTLLITHHGSGRLDIVPGINHSVQLVMLDFIPVITIYPDMSIHPDKSGRILVYLEYLPTAQSSLIPKVRNEPANKSADKKTNTHNSRNVHATDLYGNGYGADIGHILFSDAILRINIKKRSKNYPNRFDFYYFCLPKPTNHEKPCSVSSN